jgi:hypothetical protein
MSRIKREEEVRPIRVPVSSSRAPLVVKGLDTKNFSNRWVADIDDRITDFLNGGYEFVPKNAIEQAGEATVDTSKGLDNRITKSGGRGVKLYLMRIPMNLFKEDQAAKEREIAKTVEAMKSPGKGSDYGQVKIESQDPNKRTYNI